LDQFKPKSPLKPCQFDSKYDLNKENRESVKTSKKDQKQAKKDRKQAKTAPKQAENDPKRENLNGGKFDFDKEFDVFEWNYPTP